MPEKKKRKVLIVYASVTGNTEKVAMRFKQVFEKKKAPWGEWECDIYKVNKNSYKEPPPYHIEDYDLICVGSPIWAGIPPLYLNDDHRGALMPLLMPIIRSVAFEQIMRSLGKARGPIPDFGKGYGAKKSIIFVTYGGQEQGPREAQAALSCLELRLEGANAKCIGKFACCGKMWRETTVDPIANKFNWMVGDTTTAIALYKENPNHPDFAKLTAEERKMFDKAVASTAVFSNPGAGMGFRAWHWDFQNRPTERDLLKAEIFLSEILEDYYGGGIEMYPYSQYISIA